MLEDNKLEYIDPKYYPILNDFIRVGKREAKKWEDLNKFYDKTVAPYYKKAFEALKKGYKTELFEVRVHRDFSREEIIVLYLPSLQEKYPFYIDIDLTIATNVEEMFSYTVRCFQRNEFSQEAINDLKGLLDKVREENSYVLLQYTRRNKTYKYLRSKVGAIRKAQFKRMDQIIDMWEKDVAPQVGGPILYKNEYDEYKKGTVVEIKGNNDFKLFTIRAKNNKIIERDTYDSAPYNTFYLTFLHERLFDVIVGNIPECWKENRVDFYA